MILLLPVTYTLYNIYYAHMNLSVHQQSRKVIANVVVKSHQMYSVLFFHQHYDSGSFV